jgi:hypothetical protein
MKTKRLHAWIVVTALLLSPILSLLPITISQATLPPVTNFAKVTVSTGYNSAATSIVLLSGHGAKLPATFPYPVVWWNATDYASPEDDPFVEIVSVTARSVDTLTVVRAQESTAASNHNTGGKTYRMILTLTKSMWDQIQTDIVAAGGGSLPPLSGTGSPEGVVTASVGRLFLRTDGAAGTTLYTKESGAGNTGWVAVLTSTNWALPGIIGATTPNVGVFTDLFAKRFIGTPCTLTYGVTVAIDATLGDLCTVTATNSTGFTISNPTNAVTGNWLAIQVKNTSGGVLGTITWDTLYKMASFTKPASGTHRTVTFRYNGTNWDEMNCSPEVPN